MQERRRIPAFALSVVAHVAVIAILVWADQNLSGLPRVRYRVIPFPKELHPKDKIIWFKPSAPVPEVAPAEPFGPSPNPQGVKDPLNRVLIARSPDAASNKQLIRRPDHPEPLPTDVPAPNVVVMQAAEPQPAPKPAPKAFVRPPSQAVSTKSPTLVDTPPPALDKPIPARDILGVAALSPTKLPPKTFVLPPKASGAGSGRTASDAANLPVPPSISAGGNAPGPETLILGLNPAAQLPPPGSRSGQFAQAPAAGVPSSGAARPGAPVVPGVVAHSQPGVPAVSRDALPAVSGTPPEHRTLREIVSPPVNRTMSAPLRPSSRIIPSSVESIFAKRDVYALVLPPPDLPGYTGDWVMWFAEHQPQDPVSSGRISAPIPARKYFWSDAGSASAGPASGATVQFAAVIGKNGKVTATRVLRSAANEDFRRRAVEELESWEFKPALRNGEPIDVDAVLEFRLQLPAAASH